MPCQTQTSLKNLLLWEEKEWLLQQILTNSISFPGHFKIFSWKPLNQFNDAKAMQWQYKFSCVIMSAIGYTESKSSLFKNRAGRPTKVEKCIQPWNIKIQSMSLQSMYIRLLPQNVLIWIRSGDQVLRRLLFWIKNFFTLINATSFVLDDKENSITYM